MTNIERYHRQMLLEEWKQERLSSATVLIAGVGALGTVVATNLTMMGIGHLILVDFDIVELSNLNRQLLFSERDIGKPKVLAAKERLLAMNSEVEITTIYDDITKMDKSIFKECDVVIDGLDNFDIKRWLNAMCIKFRKPLIHGGIYGWYGNVQVIIPFKTPCLECHPLIPDQRLQQSCTRPDLTSEELQMQQSNAMPSISPVAMTIGSIQAMEAAKILMGINTILDAFLFYDARSEAFTKIKLSRNPECAICGDKFRTSELEIRVSDWDVKLSFIVKNLQIDYGLENPEIILNGRLLTNSDLNKSLCELSILPGTRLFVIDKRLERPLKVIFAKKQ